MRGVPRTRQIIQKYLLNWNFKTFFKICSQIVPIKQLKRAVTGIFETATIKIPGSNPETLPHLRYWLLALNNFCKHAHLPQWCNLTLWVLIQSAEWNRTFWDFQLPARKSTCPMTFRKNLICYCSHFLMLGVFYAYTGENKHNDWF